MEDTILPRPRKKQKTLNACQRCRSRKIKCSGQEPCQHCAARKSRCVFEERSKKLVVSEDYLQALQTRAAELDPQRLLMQLSPSRSMASVRSVHSEHAERPLDADRPLVSPVPTPVSFVADEQRQVTLQSQAPTSTYQSIYDGGSNRYRPGPTALDEGLALDNHQPNSSDAIGDGYRRLGHSSSWAFSRRVRNLIKDHTGSPELHDATAIRDGAYGIAWRQDTVDLSGLDLPTEEYAEYLVNTVFFSMGPLYYLFDKPSFLSKLHQFYADEQAGTEEYRDIWHVHMLLVFAFGKSILAREVGSSGPMGAAYFARAVEAVPDSHRLCQQPAPAIEVLCMLALSMQAMDMRLAAYDYIGRAMRIGLAYGLNRKLDIQRISQVEFEHRSKLFWTTYIIERKLASLLGVPSAFHDEDIALPMPSVDSPHHGMPNTMAVHVKLSSQLGHILDVVYGLGVQRQLGRRFIAAIQSILRRLADTLTMLNTSVRIELQRPMDTTSRVAASLHLLHHQCSIFAIRPVLFFLLEKKLATNSGALALSDAVIGLLRVCIESALQVLKIVDGLRSHKLVDLLLPFDLEAVFAAAFVLILTDIISPATSENWEITKTFSLMDDMTSRGVIIAKPYKNDLREIVELHGKLRGSRSCQPQQLYGSFSTGQGPVLRHGTATQGTSDLLLPNLEQDLVLSQIATDDGEMGSLHPDTIQSAIDGLNFDFLNDPSAMEMGGNEWMWGSTSLSGTSPWPIPP